MLVLNVRVRKYCIYVFMPYIIRYRSMRQCTDTTCSWTHLIAYGFVGGGITRKWQLHLTTSEPFVCENHLSRDNLDNLSFCPDICLELFFVHFVLYWLVRSNYWLKLNKWHLASIINIYCKCILIMYNLASIVNDTNSFSIKHT